MHDAAFSAVAQSVAFMSEMHAIPLAWSWHIGANEGLHLPANAQTAVCHWLHAGVPRPLGPAVPPELLELQASAKVAKASAARFAIQSRRFMGFVSS